MLAGIFVAAPLPTRVEIASQSPCLLALWRGWRGGGSLSVLAVLCFWIMPEQPQDLTFQRKAKRFPCFNLFLIQIENTYLLVSILTNVLYNELSVVSIVIGIRLSLKE